MAPGCRNEALNYLGLRLRKPSTRAVYAPDLDAFLCKDHADGGGTWSIEYFPGTGGKVSFEVQSAGKRITRRVVTIRKSAS